MEKKAKILALGPSIYSESKLNKLINLELMHLELISVTILVE